MGLPFLCFSNPKSNWEQSQDFFQYADRIFQFTGLVWRLKEDLDGFCEALMEDSSMLISQLRDDLWVFREQHVCELHEIINFYIQ